MMYMFKPFTAYANFNGRARRAEYWQWTLLMFGVNLAYSGMLRILPQAYIAPVNWISWAWAAGTLIPGLAVTVRRFHDVNKTGWWTLFLLLMPFLLIYCSIALYFFSAKYVPGKGDINTTKDYIWMAIPAIIGLFAYIPPFFFLLQDSNPQSNRFGGNPKKPGNADAVF